MARGRKRRFVVMPGRGISGPAMEAGLFHEPQPHLAENLDIELGRFDVPDSGIALAVAPARTGFTSSVKPDDFKVLSQRFRDGPAIVEMTDAARLALKASNPDLRVLPVTRYYLPGESPRRSKSARPASAVAAVTAVQADGTIFDQDLKQHLRDAIAGIGNGAGVLVGVLDTGVDGTHPALAGAVIGSRCFVPGEPAAAGGPVDWGPQFGSRSGHGTHVAGIIAARPGNGGPPGVAAEARLISYRIFPNSPGGPAPAENAVIIDSIRAAIDDGCHVLNLSFTGSTLREDGVRSAISEAWENGVLCIAAAGNDYGNPVSFPGALPHCVPVTALGRDGCFPPTPEFLDQVSNQRATSDPALFLASFSNYGPPIQFTAPGHAVVSTFPNGEWWFNSGTSMAAPYVTGLAAAFLSANNNIMGMLGNAERSAAMLQMLVSRAHVIGLPQLVQEGFGLPG